MINVLIVEDDPMVAELNKRCLERLQGFALAGMARSVDEALTLLEQLAQIDLILLDIFMPGTNGLELLTHLRRTGRGVDVIVVSSASNSHYIKEALSYGAVDYLIKPFEFERLISALLSYRDRALLIKDHEVMNQVELDRILHKEQSALLELPKGLNRHTLKKVWEELQSMPGSFTAEEIAKRVGISRVSMRKYLDFLEHIEAVQMEVVYGTVGRPVSKYSQNNSHNNIIKRYC